MTIAVAPDGEYACALGMWFDKANKFAYLEPMVPKYRRMGLDTICLTEAMKKNKFTKITRKLYGLFCTVSALFQFRARRGE